MITCWSIVSKWDTLNCWRVGSQLITCWLVVTQYSTFTNDRFYYGNLSLDIFNLRWLLLFCLKWEDVHSPPIYGQSIKWANSEERQLMIWVGIFQVGIFWVGIFQGSDFPGRSLMGGNFPGGNFSGGNFPRTIVDSSPAFYVIRKTRYLKSKFLWTFKSLNLKNFEEISGARFYSASNNSEYKIHFQKYSMKFSQFACH